jgi:uncharacterized membrane-anchored protein
LIVNYLSALPALARVARASDLLRTPVDVALQEQNRDVLLVALTYYLAVLLMTILGAVKAAGVPLNVELVAGVATPFLLGIIWLALRWTRQAVIRRHERDLD